jgi:hypothetical protein
MCVKMPNGRGKTEETEESESMNPRDDSRIGEVTRTLTHHTLTQKRTKKKSLYMTAPWSIPRLTRSSSADWLQRLVLPV